MPEIARTNLLVFHFGVSIKVFQNVIPLHEQRDDPWRTAWLDVRNT